MTPTISYTLTGLTPGVYKICTEDYYSGYSPLYRCFANVAADISYADDVTVTSGEIATGVDFVSGGDADLASISGQVTTDAGAALPDARVALLALRRDVGIWSTAPSRTVKADEHGDYRFSNIVPGVYIIRLFHEDANYVAEYYDDVIPIRAATPITVARWEKRVGIDASLAQGGVITGVVTLFGREYGFQRHIYIYPVNDMEYVCCPYPSPIDNAGRYQISRLPPGSYYVSASSYTDSGESFRGYYGGTDYKSAKPITITGAVTIPNINIDIGLGAYEAVLAGRVTDSSGRPLTGIQVELFRENRDRQSFYYTLTDAEGRYSIGGLPDDYYYVGFRDPTEVYARVFYSRATSLSRATPLLATGAKPLTQVNASLVQLGEISGKLSYTSSAPASNVQVSLLALSTNVEVVTETLSDENGAYQLRDLQPGSYIVRFLDVNRPTDHPFGVYIAYFHQRMNFQEADVVVVEEGASVKNIDQIIGGAPTALDVENEPQAPARMYLPLVAR